MDSDGMTLAKIKENFYIKEGVMYWAVDRNKKLKDTPLTRLDIGGYISVKIDGKNYRVHRLMYQLYNNLDTLDSDQKIDHIDGNRLNNHKENLKLHESRSNINEQETKSPYTGVFWKTIPGIWRAKIMVSGKIIELGTFKKLEDGAEAYDIAQIRRDPNNYSLNFPEKLDKYLKYIQENGNHIGPLEKKEPLISSNEKYITYIGNAAGYGTWRAKFVKDNVVHSKTFPYNADGLAAAIKWRNEKHLELYSKPFVK